MTREASAAPGFAAALRETLEYLDSAEGITAIAADPYWPKWDGPWWRMTLLWEMGLAEQIPPRAVRAMVSALNSQYLDYFPATENDLPPGKDIYRHTACHCMVGTGFQVLHACKVMVDEELPWLRAWMLKYQLADGGWNCDNGVTRCSSFVSTLPPAEAILHCTDRHFTPEEKNCLDRTANYLLERRLAYSKSKAALIDPAWLIPGFPRFYFYDVLRGLTFLARWAEKTGGALPEDKLREAVTALDEYFRQGQPSPRRTQLKARTLRRVDGEWVKQPEAGGSPLLEVSALPEIGGALLRKEWEETRGQLAHHSG